MNHHSIGLRRSKRVKKSNVHNDFIDSNLLCFDNEKQQYSIIETSSSPIIRTQNPTINIRDISSIYQGFVKDPIIGTKDFILQDNKLIIFTMKNYHIIVEHLQTSNNIVHISLVDKYNKFMEVKELGFDTVFRYTSNYVELTSILKEIIASEYNANCYYEIRNVGQQLKDLGYDVDMTWNVSIIIETRKINLEIELSYPCFLTGNRGIKFGDPEKPQILQAVYNNINQRCKKIRFIQKTKTFDSIEKLIEDINFYKEL